MSFLIYPYISCLWYFGANTIWYWHPYFECAELLISFFSIIVKNLRDIFLVMRSPNHLLLYHRGFSFAKASLSSPGITGGLFPRLKTPIKTSKMIFLLYIILEAYSRLYTKFGIVSYRTKLLKLWSFFLYY